MKVRIILAVAALAASLAFAADFSRVAVPTPENGITAHRGDSLRHPQNSLEAFSAANAIGADWIETDVRLTRDGVLVIIHNADTKAYCSVNKEIKSSTYAELCELDMAESFRNAHNLTLEQCPKLRIVRLDEALDLILRERKARLSIQPKCDCVDKVMALVRQKDAVEWVGFNDGSERLMSQAKKTEPSVPIFWDRYKSDLSKDIPFAKKHGFETIVMHSGDATPDNVKMLHDAGLKVGVWTVNRPVDLERFLDMGVDRIYTDDPKTLKEIKDSRRRSGKSTSRGLGVPRNEAVAPQPLYRWRNDMADLIEAAKQHENPKGE